MRRRLALAARRAYIGQADAADAGGNNGAARGPRGTANGTADGIMANGSVSRFLGGSPLRVLVQLLLLSLVVGVVMAALGLEPFDIVDWIGRTVQRIVNMGFGAVEQVFHYLLLGAVIVVPVWLILRIINAGKN